MLHAVCSYIQHVHWCTLAIIPLCRNGECIVILFNKLSLLLSCRRGGFSDHFWFWALSKPTGSSRCQPPVCFIQQLHRTSLWTSREQYSKWNQCHICCDKMCGSSDSWSEYPSSKPAEDIHPERHSLFGRKPLIVCCYESQCISSPVPGELKP